jgi:hypothetical protein
MKLTHGQRTALLTCAKGGTPSKCVSSLVKKKLIIVYDGTIDVPVRPPLGIAYRGQTTKQRVTYHRLTPTGYEVYEALRVKEYEDVMNREADQLARDLASAKGRVFGEVPQP